MSTTDESSTNKNSQKDYERLPEDYQNYDLSFKVIVIGNSGNFYFIKYIKIINNKYRSWKILFINASNKTEI